MIEDKLYFDNIFDYDSWEYFEEELQGKERILKAISSVMKDKIGFNLLLNTYDYLKYEESVENLKSYTKEEINLSGIKKI